MQRSGKEWKNYFLKKVALFAMVGVRVEINYSKDAVLAPAHMDTTQTQLYIILGIWAQFGKFLSYLDVTTELYKKMTKLTNYEIQVRVI